MAQKRAVLFDLGNTLVQYFDRIEFPRVLEQAIVAVQSYLLKSRLLTVPEEVMWQGVSDEDHEAADFRVRPLEDRLARIFQLGPDQINSVGQDLCRAFLVPIFATGRSYGDTVPTLQQLGAQGIRIAIVSNAPWGSPGDLWRKELTRMGLRALVDEAVFCTDVGWRKPAGPIFEHALEALSVSPQECVFVGDDPRWDMVGPQALGIKSVLIDRGGLSYRQETMTISGLDELLMMVGK